MTIYAEGPVWTDDLAVGDVIAFEAAGLWGPVTAITPYEPCPFGDGYRVARFASGQEMTLEPRGCAFPPWATFGEFLTAYSARYPDHSWSPS